MTYSLNIGDIVMLAKNYIVFESGNFNLLDLVLCKRIDESNNSTPTCMFLTATIVGIDLNEENT